MIKVKLFIILFFSILSARSHAADIHVSTSGSDFNTGSIDKPLASLHAAIRKARELRRLNNTSIQNGIRIIIQSGFYTLNEPIVFRPEDSGTAESPTEIVSAKGAKVVFSGGIQIKNWKKVNTSAAGLPKKSMGKVWVAEAPIIADHALQFRQLWVNGKKAIKAKSTNGDEMERILSWNAKTETCKIPTSKIADLSKIKGLEMIIHQWWAIANLRVKSVKINGDSTELAFMQPESRIQSEHPWPAPWISSKTGNSAFYLSNAIQFLDEPGEWFEDLLNHKIYYWPKKDENMLSANVIAPALENLLKMEGNIDFPVAYIHFKGISFQHASWLRPSMQGHVPHQAGMYMLDAYKLKTPGTKAKETLENQAWVGRPAAAVELNYTNNITFDSCSFVHNASTALDLNKGTQHNLVRGNLFKDAGGTGILVGTFSDESTEVHLPYNPSDLREISSGNIVENNLITDVTNEDWGAVGIGAGYVRDLQINHNEISNVSYSGISMGWGWTKNANAMQNNRIYANKIQHYGKHMYDVAGIYTLSAQPKSEITENVVDSIYKAKYAHLPDHWFYMYTDEGSSGFNIERNWTPAQKYLQNANGPGNFWENNGQDVSNEIKKNAGLQSSFRYLLKEKSQVSATYEINKAIDKPVVFELIFASDQVPKEKILLDFAKENNLSKDEIYRWQNRVVIFTSTLKTESLQQTLKRLNAKQIKFYDDLFYSFDREKNCGEKPVKEWTNIILSADLVADSVLQKEYFSYHKTQFEKWPEVARGFCNANFQRLIMFRNGQQLMLIISIPKGENLDKLNPKTTENNPRVVEWNTIMQKYQQGIEGTKKGEVWVFFNSIN